MATYLHKAKKLLKFFSLYMINQILRSQNVEVDAFARLASEKDANQLKFILVETLSSPSI